MAEPQNAAGIACWIERSIAAAIAPGSNATQMGPGASACWPVCDRWRSELKLRSPSGWMGTALGEDLAPADDGPSA